jgi:hypothetical protein
LGRRDKSRLYKKPNIKGRRDKSRLYKKPNIKGRRDKSRLYKILPIFVTMRRTSGLCRFKIVFTNATNGTHPVIGYIFKRGAWFYPPFWVAFLWVVGKAAGVAYI